MPLVMSLEGPKLAPAHRTMGQLLGLVPKPMQRPAVQLSGLFDPFFDHKAAVLLGLLVGGWLAGTASGRATFARARSYLPRRR